MHSIKFVLMITALALSLSGVLVANSPLHINLPEAGQINVLSDDTVPEVTARVARISYISGDVQIRRFESQEWEQATLNLPIVEGDEITTSRDARFEIQFDRNTHLRINENAYLKVSKLLDEGIALSLSQGTVALRANSFDKDRSYFEIDAPGSTIAVQRSGMYRIDAGQPGDTEIRVAATSGGEARLYSETSGFTIKNGRSARIFVGGSNAGEWEPGDASLNADSFDLWVLDRDMAVAKSLEKAHYNTYYDQDIYGAEDLGDYGEWVYTKKYGYVWRPFRTTVSSYSDWSPYRYGHWRWIPPYGWTWVNDEPWGWATYHHGRWFYDEGYWNWSPYGYYRSMRSWWSPAMVVITTWGGSICWYPLPYSYAYYNYNYYYNNHGWGGGHGGPHPTPTPRVTPNPVGTPTPVVAGPIDRIKGPKLPPFQTVPPTGVVTVNADQFGRIRKGNQMPPLAVANAVLSTVPNDRTGVKLPTIKEIKGPLSTGIKAEQPPMVKTQSPVRTGATVRNTDKPLDNDLRTTRVFGGRPPMTTRPAPPPTTKTDSPVVRTPRDTGVIVRPPTVKTEVPTPPMTRTPRPTAPPAETSRPPETTKPTPRYDPPVRETPRYNPPPPRQDTPRNDPPPTRQPPKSDPPAAKPAPKPETKPAPIEDRGGGKQKDGPGK